MKKEHKIPTKVPDVVFKTRVRDESVEGMNPYRWQDVTSDEVFKGKKIVLFALPGAFTPTCSSTHLPGYETSYDKFKKLGVDEVICLSVLQKLKCFPTVPLCLLKGWECWLKKTILDLESVAGVTVCMLKMEILKKCSLSRDSVIIVQTIHLK